MTVTERFENLLLHTVWEGCVSLSGKDLVSNSSAVVMSPVPLSAFYRQL